MNRLAVLFLFVFVGAVFSIGYCDDQVVKTIKLFYACVEKGDIETLFTLIPSAIAKKIKETNSPAGIKSDVVIFLGEARDVKQGKKKIKYKDIKVKILKQSGDYVLANCSYKVEIWENGVKKNEEVNDKMTLKKEGKKWVVAEIKDDLEGEEED